MTRCAPGGHPTLPQDGQAYGGARERVVRYGAGHEQREPDRACFRVIAACGHYVPEEHIRDAHLGTVGGLVQCKCRRVRARGAEHSCRFRSVHGAHHVHREQHACCTRGRPFAGSRRDWRAAACAQGVNHPQATAKRRSELRHATLQRRGARKGVRTSTLARRCKHFQRGNTCHAPHAQWASLLTVPAMLTHLGCAAHFTLRRLLIAVVRTGLSTIFMDTAAVTHPINLVPPVPRRNPR
jgi:hypothetical protein